MLVGARSNPKAAVLVVPAQEAGKIQTIPLSAGLDSLHPQTLVDILSMQERIFGKSGLTLPLETAG